MNKAIICFFVFINFLMFSYNGICEDDVGLDSALDKPSIVAESTVPPGFEELSRPQRSLVDVYYGNRYLTSLLATYTPKTIRFSDPAKIIKLIGDINDPVVAAEGLTGDLNSNVDKICFKQGENDCGVIEPDITGVIFDENRFRADIFVNRRFLLTRSAEVNKFLPPSDGDLSFIQNLSATISGTRGNNSIGTATDSEDYNLYGESIFAKEENSIYSSWDYSKNQHYSVGSLYGQREYEGVHYRAGLVSTEGFGLSFNSDRTLTGFRVSSSDNTRADVNFSGGMPLDVFLTTRGRVEVRRENRLIASFFLEAGSQQLDTSAFPSGVYDVEIKILDDQGNQIGVETRFFAKQFDLPPEGEWRYFIEAGNVMDRDNDQPLPKMTTQLLARSGISRRLTDTLATTVSAVVNSRSSLIEAGLFNIGYRYELSPSFMMSNDGAYGVNLTGHLKFGDITANASYRQLWNRNFDLAAVQKDDPDLLGAAFSQSNISLSTRLFTGSAHYRFSENHTDSNSNTANRVTRIHTYSYQLRIYHISNLNIDMSSSYSQSNDDEIALLSFTFSLSDNHWTWRATPKAERAWRDSGDTRSEKGRVSATWEDKDMFDSLVRVNMGAEGGRGDERYDTRLEVGNSWGKADMALNHVVTSSNTTTSYSGSLKSSFMTDGNHIAIGGEQTADSALMINVTGKDGDVFDVNVNGRRRGYAVVGRSSLVPVRSYNQYIVSISPAGSALYDFDEREQEVTLYPGNVVSLDYNAVALQLMFGRLLYNGKAVSGAHIKGGVYAASTDDVGLFQLEVNADKKVVDVVLDDGRTCKLAIPEGNEDNIIHMGTIDLTESDCHVPIPNAEVLGEKDNDTKKESQPSAGEE